MADTISFFFRSLALRLSNGSRNLWRRLLASGGSASGSPRNASIVSTLSMSGLPMYWYLYCLGQFSKEPRLEWE